MDLRLITKGLAQMFLAFVLVVSLTLATMAAWNYIIPLVVPESPTLNFWHVLSFVILYEAVLYFAKKTVAQIKEEL